MLTIEVGPGARAKVDHIITQLGESEFRRRVALATRYHIDDFSLEDVIKLFVAERRGKVHPPEAGRRAAALFPHLPPATADDPCIDVRARPVEVLEAS